MNSNIDRDKEFYEFGQFRLDVAERLLARAGGKRIQLSEKAFETLCVLVRNAGHLIRKDELMNQVWADSFVEENNLDKCIYAIRKALGEKPGAQKFIETVRKHGYRFVVEVRRIEEDSETERRSDGEKKINLETDSFSPILPVASSLHRSVAPSHKVVAIADWRHETDKNQPEESIEQFTKLELVPTNPVIKSKSKFRAFVVAGLILGTIIGLGYYFFYTGKTASGVDGKKSIAVLPLKPINAPNRDEIYELGIAESLIYRLGSMKGFIIRPLSATRQYSDINQDALAAGREQKTDYVLASNYQMADGRIRITAQLFNVASGQIEETYKSEKDFTNIFAMQDAIAGEVGNLLQARFATTSSSQKAVRGTDNEEAYRLYLQGKYIFENGSNFEAAKAVEAFEQAIRLDPNYAQAWASKATAHQFFASYGRDTNIQEHNQKSLEAINKALALDANLSEAHAALCGYKLNYEWNFAEAESACRRAIELDPNLASAHQIYAGYLSSRGRFDESVAEMKIAKDLEPASLIREAMDGLYLDNARRYDEAVAQYKRVVEMNDNFGAVYPFLYHTLSLQGKYDEAFEWYLKSPWLREKDAKSLQPLRKIYKESGWQGIKQLQAKNTEEGNAAYYFCVGVNAEVGNKDRAFEYLEKAFARREPRLVFLQVDPRFDALRDDPRFDELLRRIGLK